MTPAEMKTAETPAPTGGSGQPEPSNAEMVSQACVQATQVALARMQSAMQSAGHTPAGT